MDYTTQYSEWLSAYIDGELEPTLEEPLFAALATHADLRHEMRELLALRRAARNDLVALVPPLSTTAALFQSVGIGTGLGVGLGLLRRLWLPLASALIGSTLTWLGLTLTSPPSTQPATVTTQRPTPTPLAVPETTIVERVVYRTKTVYVPLATSSKQTISSPTSPQALVVEPTPTAHQTVSPLIAALPQFDVFSPPLVVRRYQVPSTPTTDAAVVHTPTPPDLPSPEAYPQFR
ncbi:MAG: hypothetical protein N2663_04535, partial [Chlorobi bacterium]|nr:hypothetical protein [Chlorobiota bacterium]